jgi:hypothetical protein
VWFPEPASPDPTFARRREPTVAWIRRSTVGRAVATRAMLNQNIACLPLKFQESLVPRLDHEWASAYFELAVARVLQQLGATLAVEKPTLSGKRPDYLAHFADGSVTVEAVSPVINAELKAEDALSAPLYDEIMHAAPEGWWIFVHDLPSIGPNESRRWFRKLIRQLLEVPRPGADAQPIVLDEPTPFGRLRLELRPRADGGLGIGTEAVRGAWDDTKSRIISAVNRKRRQVRAAATPVLLAINASGIASCMEDFDVALFGHQVDEVDMYGRRLGTSYRFDGALSRPSADGRPPTYAGVLAFHSEGLHVDDPVLYLHPRFGGALPRSLLSLELRTVGPDPDGMRTVPASRRGVLRCMDIEMDDTVGSATMMPE